MAALHPADSSRTYLVCRPGSRVGHDVRMLLRDFLSDPLVAPRRGQDSAVDAVRFGSEASGYGQQGQPSLQ